MSDIGTWILAAVTIVSFLGSAAVYLRGSRDKGTIETLERNNDALNERVGILEAEAIRRDASDKVKDARIEALEREKEVLQNVANSSGLIKDLAASLETHHSQAMAGMATIHTDLSNIQTALGGDS